MTNKLYGPYAVEFMGPGVHAGIAAELPPELAGKSVVLKVLDTEALTAAYRTLNALGYTYHGGEQWKPPLNQSRQEYAAR